MRHDGRGRTGLGVLVAIACCIAFASVQAQAPQEVNYQGLVTDQNGVPMATGTYSMQFRIYATPTGGSALYFLSIPSVEVIEGYFNVVLTGLGSGVLDGDRYVGIAVGGGTEILPRQQFLSAPFAISAGDLVGGVYTDSLSDGTGRLFTKGPNGSLNVGISSQGSPGNFGYVSAYNAVGSTRAQFGVSSSSSGFMNVFGTNGSWNVATGGSDFGTSSWYNDASALKARVSVSSSGHGTIQTWGSNGTTAILNTVSSSSGRSLWYDDSGVSKVDLGVIGDIGFMNVKGLNGTFNVTTGSYGSSTGVTYWYDDAGAARASVFVDTVGLGVVTTYGPNGNLNFRASWTGVEDRGSACTFNSDGTQGACIQGSYLTGIDTLAVSDHPSKSGSKIVYAGVSSAESTIVSRGKIVLTNGRGVIELPEHFAAQAAPGSLTVSLTPYSLDSKGVGVGNITRNKVEIGELLGGTADYEVSYVIHAVRQSRIDHQAVLDETEFQRSYGVTAESAQALAIPSPPDAVNETIGSISANPVVPDQAN